MKKSEIGALGIRYEKAPTTLNTAPEAPSEEPTKPRLANKGRQREKKDAITAELRYIVKKFAAPTMAQSEVPNDESTNIFTKMCIGSW